MKWNESDFHIFDNYKEYIGKDDEFANFRLLCKQFYSEKTLEHCYSVRSIVLDILSLNTMSHFLTGEHQFIEAVALGHDLLEDTDFLQSEYADSLSADMEYCLSVLARKKCQTYEDYIAEIASYTNKLPEFKTLAEAAYIVKLADLIDHLMRYKTLSNSLKERYLKALDIMLQEEN